MVLEDVRLYRRFTWFARIGATRTNGYSAIGPLHSSEQGFTWFGRIEEATARSKDLLGLGGHRIVTLGIG